MLDNFQAIWYDPRKQLQEDLTLSIIKAYTVRLNDMPGPTYISKNELLAGIQEDFSEELSLAHPGDSVSLSVTVNEMTQEAFDALPEWGGY
jgi:hypothetical protein